MSAFENFSGNNTSPCMVQPLGVLCFQKIFQPHPNPAKISKKSSPSESLISPRPEAVWFCARDVLWEPRDETEEFTIHTFQTPEKMLSSNLPPSKSKGMPNRNTSWRPPGNPKRCFSWFLYQANWMAADSTYH